jgi:hypothetical protein
MMPRGSRDQSRRGALRAPFLRAQVLDGVGAHGSSPCKRKCGVGWGAQPCAPTLQTPQFTVGRARAARPYAFGAVRQ